MILWMVVKQKTSAKRSFSKRSNNGARLKSTKGSAQLPDKWSKITCSARGSSTHKHTTSSMIWLTRLISSGTYLTNVFHSSRNNSKKENLRKSFWIRWSGWHAEKATAWTNQLGVGRSVRRDASLAPQKWGMNTNRAATYLQPRPPFISIGQTNSKKSSKHNQRHHFWKKIGTSFRLHRSRAKITSSQHPETIKHRIFWLKNRAAVSKPKRTSCFQSLMSRFFNREQSRALKSGSLLRLTIRNKLL